MTDVPPHRPAVSPHSSKRSSNSQQSSRYRMPPLPFSEATGPHSTMSAFEGKADILFDRGEVCF